MKWKLTESELSRFNPFDSPRPIVTHHMCHSPKYYNVKVLPQKIKNEISIYYEEYKNWIILTDFDDRVKNNFAKTLDGVIKFMNSEDYSNEWLPHFIDQTKKLDSIRNQNILNVVPQYKDIFRK
jgi:hypothetical protein